MLLLVYLGSAMAKAEPLDAAASDPNVKGWMQDFPPADERIIGYPASDYFSFPKLRWTFCHFREMQATKRVGRGVGPLSLFSEALAWVIARATGKDFIKHLSLSVSGSRWAWSRKRT